MEKKEYGFPIDSAKYFYGNAGLYFRKFVFSNGYAASVVSHRSSYGGNDGAFEVAVMRADNDQIVYDTPITSDVLGHLGFAEVAEVLIKIRDLPQRCWKCNPPTFPKYDAE